MADPTPELPDDAPTPTLPVSESEGTQTFHHSKAPTKTQETPADYFPPSPPNPNLPDNHDPPQGQRFHSPLFHKKGGMGRVFSAADEEFNRRVALKDIQPRHREKDWYRRKFIFEAEITGELEHPGVVPVYSLRRPDGEHKHPHYAMRFIEGETLASAIREFHANAPRTSLTGEQSVVLRRLLARFLTVCQTIAYAHSRRIIHRDLKPDNIMLGPFGETLVVDWGLAKRLHSGETAPVVDSLQAPLTSTGGGTPGFWSPEQAELNTAAHDERTDVYGLGAVLFCILTGASPHPKGRHAHVPPQPNEISLWVDAALNAITVRAIALRPEDRFQSANELASAVEQWMADQPVAAQRATVQILRERSIAEPEDDILKEQFARQLSNLGQVYQGMGRDADAVESILESAGIFEQLFDKNPTVPRFRAEQANGYIAAAPLLDSLGRSAEAERYRSEAAEIYRGLIARHPGEYRQNLATIIITREFERPPTKTLGISDDDMADSQVAIPRSASTDDGQQTLDTGPVEELPQPELVQGYTVQKVLGQGALGNVLLARDNALQRLVAIKEFAQEFTGVRAKRFLREIQLTANLRHPNIVQVYTYGIHSGTNRPFLVMEYVVGESLKSELKAFHQSPSPISPENDAFRRLLNAFAQACSALAYAHSNNIVHRDVKPANIIVQPDGGAVVIDWGIAKGIGEKRDLAAEDVGDDADFSEQMTMTGTIVGTPVYLAPEMISSNVNANPSLDIYALGTILFEILTGRLPFEGKSPLELLLLKSQQDPPRPRSLNPSVPGLLEMICLRAMAREPSQRYPSVAAMLADINKWLQSDGEFGYTRSDPAAAGMPVTSRAPRNWKPTGAAETLPSRSHPPVGSVPPPTRGRARNPLSRLLDWIRGR